MIRNRVWSVFLFAGLVTACSADSNGKVGGKIDLNDPAIEVEDETNSSAITITAPNVTTAEDTPVSVVIKTSAAAKIVIDTGPTHGTLADSGGTYTYTPAADFTGADSIVAHAEADGVKSKPVTVAITVTPVNDLPVAQALNASLHTARATAIPLRASDPDGDSLTFAVTTPPAHGTVELSGAVATYKSDNGYLGADSFSYTANDGTGVSAPASVAINVNDANTPPVVSPVSVATNEDVSVTIDLNVVDPDGQKLTYLLVSDAAHGRVQFSNGKNAGKATYDPDADYNGPDSFSYRVSDGTALSATVTVSIAVLPVNDLPVAADITRTFNEDTTTSVELTAVDADGDAFVINLDTPPANGTLFVTGTTAVYVPEKNYFGTDSFTYRAVGTVLGPLATVTLQVTSVNDRPVANGGTYVTNEDTSFAVSISDVEESDLTFTYNPAITLGTIVKVETGYVFQTAANKFGHENFTVIVSDGDLDAASVTFDVTVNSVDDLPSMRFSETSIQTHDIGDYVQIGPRTELNVTSDGFTLEAWIYPTYNIEGHIITNDGMYVLKRDSAGYMDFAVSNGSPGWSWINTGIYAPLNEWTHIAVVYYPSSIYMYHDGAPFYISYASGSIYDAWTWVNDVRIGSRESEYSNNFIGKIDDVRIWNVSRSGAEILANMWYPPATDATGLLGWWRMEEAEGNVVKDATGKGNDGVIVGDATWATTDDRYYKDRFFCCSDRTYNVFGVDGDGDPFYPTVVTGPTGGTLYQYDAGARGAEITSFPAQISDLEGRIIFAAPGYGEFWFGAALTDGVNAPDVVPFDLNMVSGD